MPLRHITIYIIKATRIHTPHTPLLRQLARYADISYCLCYAIAATPYYIGWPLIISAIRHYAIIADAGISTAGRAPSAITYGLRCLRYAMRCSR